MIAVDSKIANIIIINYIDIISHVYKAHEAEIISSPKLFCAISMET